MREFQKRGILKEDRGKKLDFKCDKCGEIIGVFGNPERNDNNNGGCNKIVCDKCDKIREKRETEHE